MELASLWPRHAHPASPSSRTRVRNAAAVCTRSSVPPSYFLATFIPSRLCAKTEIGHILAKLWHLVPPSSLLDAVVTSGAAMAGACFCTEDGHVGKHGRKNIFVANSLRSSQRNLSLGILRLANLAKWSQSRSNSLLRKKKETKSSRSLS